MFDNVFVLTSPVTDSGKNQVTDGQGDPIEGRAYTGILAKFAEGVPAQFRVSRHVRDNADRGLYSVQDSGGGPVKDSKSRDLDGRGYSTGHILDSGNTPILEQATFSRK